MATEKRMADGWIRIPVPSEASLAARVRASQRAQQRQSAEAVAHIVKAYNPTETRVPPGGPGGGQWGPGGAPSAPAAKPKTPRKPRKPRNPNAPKRTRKPSVPKTPLDAHIRALRQHIQALHLDERAEHPPRAPRAKKPSVGKKPGTPGASGTPKTPRAAARPKSVIAKVLEQELAKLQAGENAEPGG